MHRNTYAHKKNSRVRKWGIKWIGRVGRKNAWLSAWSMYTCHFRESSGNSESLNDLILDPPQWITWQPPHLPKPKKTHSGKMKRYALKYAIEFVLFYFALKDKHVTLHWTFCTHIVRISKMSERKNKKKNKYESCCLVRCVWKTYKFHFEHRIYVSDIPNCGPDSIIYVRVCLCMVGRK